MFHGGGDSRQALLFVDMMRNKTLEEIENKRIEEVFESDGLESEQEEEAGPSKETECAQGEDDAVTEASNDDASKTQDMTPQAKAKDAGNEADETAGQALP